MRAGGGNKAVCIHHVRVRYGETDQMGVAYHGAYVQWIEEGRTEWIRERGRSYRSLEEKGLFLTVARLSIRYIQPAHYDDLIRIETRLENVGPASIDMHYRLLLEEGGNGGEAGRILAEAETRLAALNADRRPTRLPREHLGIDGGTL